MALTELSPLVNGRKKNNSEATQESADTNTETNEDEKGNLGSERL